MIEDLEKTQALKFNDIDRTINENNQEEEISAPKTIERLEDISVTRNLQRKLEEEDTYDEDDEKITITTEPINLNGFDSLDEDVTKISNDDVLLNDIEELPAI
jgi:hypothetical protein